VKQTFNYRTKKVEYVLDEQEFLQKLKISGSVCGLYLSTAHNTIKIIMCGDSGEKK